MESSPYKPGDEERDCYFHGFSGSPKLVARTGHNRWTKSQFESSRWSSELTQHRKHYMSLDDPDIIGKWSRDLSTRIVTALGQCKWSYFFPVRTCLRDDNHRQEGTATTILLVAVEPGSLQWQKGINVALSCRDIIRVFKIFDVEVEIMEGRHTEHAASTQLEPYFDPDHKRVASAILPLLSYTGYPIAYLQDRKGQGTVGLHIKLGTDESIVYGLTCRHVVSNDLAVHESYKPSAKDRQCHIQASETTFDDILHQLKSMMAKEVKYIKNLECCIKEWDDWYQFDNPKNKPQPTEAERRKLIRRQRAMDYITSVIGILEQIEDRGQRQIGHLAFLPTFTVSPRQSGYLRDWALVELNSEKFISGSDNRVFLGFDPNYLNDEDLDLSLRLPVAIPRSSYDVAKRGATTGLTFGTKSGVEAVVRRPGEDVDFYTWELLIVPQSGSKKFSDKGDSGSAVFNWSGEVVGIVTGGNGVTEHSRAHPLRSRRFKDSNVTSQDADEISVSEMVKLSKGTDVTFAAPIKWVLDDIEDFTGQKVQLA